MINKAEADEKVQNEKYIRVWAAFEVLAINEDKAKESLTNLINKIDQDKKIQVYEKEFSEPVKVENPTKTIKQAYSITCDLKLIAKNVDNLLQFVISYGPSAIEIIEPNEIKMQIGEVQNILNTVSGMMHKFAAAGIGGLVFINKE
ncbi:MAG: hypothetical protein J7K26_01700 [Candidatus Aenigmarchaeota archaeon]|nr:hypothetical protein [Candidatus Aenigmarchaeota archaeon]